ncbi:type II toxin-antitoxin system Phd/YefM family antitoxin [Streptomyces sp. NPDC051018]|uniref:type II toxin-antitoxin system Phd/YefM family antitoxin n=1 Tax=Streptomyces sp. NPDC051018 TaxID=3365639 RepID=UPI003796A936
MCAAMEEAEDFECGIREARRDFSNLVSKVEQGSVVHLTRHGRRVAALVGAEDLQRRTLEDVMAYPGDVESATRVIEGLLSLSDNPVPLPDASTAWRNGRAEFAGGIATLLFCFASKLDEYSENGRIKLLDDEGKESPDRVSLAELIAAKLLLTKEDSGIDDKTIPLVAGTIWATQLGELPQDWRNSLGVPLCDEELHTWIYATYFAADLINLFAGRAGEAEGWMYFAEEFVRNGGE